MVINYKLKVIAIKIFKMLNSSIGVLLIVSSSVFLYYAVNRFEDSINLFFFVYFFILYLALKKSKVFQKKSVKKIFGILFTIYLALFTLSWANYEFNMNRFDQNVNMLSVFATSSSRNMIGEQLTRLSQKKLPAKPSIYEVSVVLNTIFFPESMYYTKEDNEKFDKILDLLSLHEIWYDMDIKLSMDSIYHDLSYGTIAGSNIEILTQNNITSLIDSFFYGIKHYSFLQKNIKYINNVRFKYSNIYNFDINPIHDDKNIPSFYKSNIKWYEPNINMFNIHNSIVKDSDMSNVFIENSEIESSVFINTKFNNTHFHRVNFNNTFFEKCDFNGAVLISIPSSELMEPIEIIGRRYPYTEGGLINKLTENSSDKKMRNIIISIIFKERNDYDYSNHKQKMFDYINKTSVENNSTIATLHNTISLKNTSFVACNMTKFWISGIYGKKTIMIDENIDDEKLLRYVAKSLSNAATFYRSRMPEKLRMHLEEINPNLFLPVKNKSLRELEILKEIDIFKNSIKNKSKL